MSVSFRNTRLLSSYVTSVIRKSSYICCSSIISTLKPNRNYTHTAIQSQSLAQTQSQALAYSHCQQPRRRHCVPLTVNPSLCDPVHYLSNYARYVSSSPSTSTSFSANWVSDSIEKVKKCKFQGHAIQLERESDIERAIQALEAYDKKVSKATHFIYAVRFPRCHDSETTETESETTPSRPRQHQDVSSSWSNLKGKHRLTVSNKKHNKKHDSEYDSIGEPPQSQPQAHMYIECKDDAGETGAGEQILEMLRRQSPETDGVLVLVNRWYGGAHLGTQRYRIIRACAQAAIHKWKQFHPH
jgi:putative IMPACT (imprinted ancient) family translation regulator